VDCHLGKAELVASLGSNMKAPFFCFALAVLPASGQEASLVPIALYTEFQREPPPTVFAALQDEVNLIMASSGLGFTWRALSEARSGIGSVDLAVITLKGRCDVAGLTRHGSNPGPLGWTHISGGVILPFAEVDCQGIRGLIQKQLITMGAESREEAFGRALGRVVAHELYHIFAKTARHSSSGVGKSKFSVQELLSPDFRFAARESLALKTSNVHAALERANLLSRPSTAQNAR